MDKWFSIQAAAPATDAAKIRDLTRHKAFTIRNPNRARSVYGVFGSANLHAFHAADGSGYELVAEAVREIDTINPMVASRLVRCFGNWARFDERRRAKSRKALQTLAQNPASSGLLRELTGKMLE
jgi:aminopeptidase N